ncbi:MAG TPA: HAD family phosphatase [Devosia sp.]|jgi:FMN phosphatase YigB (HAD superfamily)|nr:HAD family phosphatase [Devosia sp.]
MTDTVPIPVFDIGNVFVEWDPMLLFRKLFPTEEEAQWFHDTVCTKDWNLEFDAGDSFADGVASLTARFPRYWREIQAFDARWAETVGPFVQGTIDIHDELIAADVPTFAITNFSREKWVSCLGVWPFLEKFDGMMVSGIEKLVKPDPRIYRVFCERYGLAPESCVFIDDSLPNIESARRFGMQVIHFTEAGSLRTELIELGLPLAPNV